MGEHFEVVKNLLITVFVWLLGQLSDNPLGVISAVIGIMYLFQRYLTQKAEKKIKEIELKQKMKEDGEVS